MRPEHNLLDEKFGQREVIGYAGKDGCHFWWCKCSCGRIDRIISRDLRAGKGDKCRNCNNTKHGNSRKKWRSPEYATWNRMIDRCHNPNHDAYCYYGARGITICDRWRESFQNFLTDVGQRPGPDHSIDRIDNYKGYEPGNVRWATRQEQANNRRDNKTFTLNGVTKTQTEWARAAGVGLGSLKSRLRRGWPLERALTTPRTKY
jgi:hypothetical protein